MTNFMLAFQVVFPMLVMIGVGILIRRVGLVDQPTARKIDNVNFWVFLPCLLFDNIYNTDPLQTFSPRTLGFAVAGFLVLLAGVVLIVPRLVKERERISVVCQGLTRASFVVFGITIAQHIYGEGNVGSAALVSAVLVPIVNITSTTLLEYYRPTGSGRPDMKKLLLGIARNPFIIASVLALVLAALGCKLPSPVSGVITTMGRAGSPLSFVALGVALNFAGLRKNRRILTFVVLARMLLIPAVFLSAAIAMGFRGTELIALSVLFASPTAAASFTAAQQMGGDGELAAQIVALTSILSIATIFGMICLFQALALL